MEEQEGTFIELIDEDGKPCTFDLLLAFEYEKRRYLALLPTEPVEGVGEDEVVILEVVRDSDGERYVPIENPVLLEEVFEEFQDLFEEESARLDGDGPDEDEA